MSLLAACASNVPPTIREPPPTDFAPTQVRDDARAYFGKPARWGGKIIELHNRADETVFQVLVYPLDGSGRPRLTDTSSTGRVLIQATGFFDPAIYAKDRELTATGVIADIVTQPIGDYPYRYVILKADTVYLWPLRIEPNRYDPYWYDPYWPYDPYYPFGPRGFPYRHY